MTEYINPADDVGTPIFNKGDMVVSFNPNWSTMRSGRKAIVEQCYWSRTKRKWMITVKHPKFGLSDYDAAWFKHYHQPAIEEKSTMHIALDITEHKKLEPGLIHDPLVSESSYFCQDRSLATVKNLVKEQLQKEPERVFAIFSLAYIAEVDQPVVPVRFRDMR